MDASGAVRLESTGTPIELQRQRSAIVYGSNTNHNFDTQCNPGPRHHSLPQVMRESATQKEMGLVERDAFLGTTLSSLVDEEPESISDILSIVYCTADATPSKATCMPLAAWMTYDVGSVAEPPDPGYCLEECKALRRSVSYFNA